MSVPSNRISESAPTGALRASDSEREAVVDHLRAATSEGRLTLDEFEERVQVVLAARTRDDLAPVTADLPTIAPARFEAARPTGTPTSRPVRPGSQRRRRMVSVFGSARHAGLWEASPAMTVVAVFGHCHIDLAACRLPPGVNTIELRTFGVFAGVELVVPLGAVVDAGGFSLFGGRHLDHGSAAESASGLHVRVRSYGAFGGVVVRNSRRVP